MKELAIEEALWPTKGHGTDVLISITGLLETRQGEGQ